MFLAIGALRALGYDSKRHRYNPGCEEAYISVGTRELTANLIGSQHECLQKKKGRKGQTHPWTPNICQRQEKGILGPALNNKGGLLERKIEKKDKRNYLAGKFYLLR